MVDVPDPAKDAGTAYGFNKADVKRVGRAVRWAEKVRRNVALPRTQYGGGLGLRIGKTGGSPVPVRSTLTLGSATVALYDSNDSGVIADSGDTATAYNISGTTVPAGKYCWMLPFLDGYGIISVEC